MSLSFRIVITDVWLGGGTVRCDALSSASPGVKLAACSDAAAAAERPVTHSRAPSTFAARIYGDATAAGRFPRIPPAAVYTLYAPCRLMFYSNHLRSEIFKLRV